MTGPMMVAAALAGLGTAAFACFTWGTLRHFVRHDAGSSGAWAISLLSCAVILHFLWRVYHGAAATWPAALVLFAASIVLWAWTLRTTQVAPPTLAFTEDVPRSLYVEGPYRWVRHPFYTAYMTCWIGTALGTPGPVGWGLMLVVGAFYWVAARHEEAKFGRSPMAGSYQAYRRRTGMFFPHVPPKLQKRSHTSV